jgi:hypothetical protein
MLVSVKVNADFSWGCADRGISHLLLATHPYHPCSREWFCTNTRRPMILAAANLYSLLHYLVLAMGSKAERSAILRPDGAEAMRDSGYELRRMLLSTH